MFGITLFYGQTGWCLIELALGHALLETTANEEAVMDVVIIAVGGGIHWNVCWVLRLLVSYPKVVLTGDQI